MWHGDDSIDPHRLARLIAAIPTDRFAAQRWFGAKERRIARRELADAAPVPGRATEPEAVLVVVGVGYADGSAERYLLPLVRAPDSDPEDLLSIRVPDESGNTLLREPRDGDGLARRLIEGLAAGTTLPGLHGVFVCEAGPALAALLPASALTDARLPERGQTIDQTNTSRIVGERVLVKIFRRLVPGINPDIELGRFLAERTDFRETPAFAGSIRYVDPDGVSSSAMLAQAYVAEGLDGWAATVAELRGWLTAPTGSVSIDAASAEAVRLGVVTARLHAALASAAVGGDFAPRRADAADTRAWRLAAERHLDDALMILTGEAGREVARLAPWIRPRFAAFERVDPPILIRTHGDYHLGQVLRAGERRMVVDFEGEPTRSLDERRERQSPLRDVASMLRSFDHVVRQALREAGNGSGFDPEAWLRRSRQRFLAAYRTELKKQGAPIVLDPALLRAFEFAKECDELIYEATYLPEWLWMPLASMRALVSGASKRPLG